jgi:hypothetical protein
VVLVLVGGVGGWWLWLVLEVRVVVVDIGG